MTTPLIDFLASAFAALPLTERPSLHLMVRDSWSVLFAHDSRITDTILVDRAGKHAGLLGIGRLAAEIRAGHYDAVLLGPPSLRAGLVASLARIKCRIGYATDGRGLLLNPGLGAGPRGSRHFSFEMLSLGLTLLESLDISAPELVAAGLPVSTLPGCARMAPTNFPGSRPVWLVAPGTTYGEAKTWPSRRVAEFVNLAVRENGAKVVLLGDGGAADFVAGLRNESSLNWSEEICADADVIDLAGRTNLEQVVKVMKSGSVFVGNDSGLMHLAGALGLPTVGIFGSSNPDWTHPLGKRVAAVSAEGFDCRPCYRKTCNQAQFCLETISARTVLDQVHEMLVDAD